jgi:hypothetical protein
VVNELVYSPTLRTDWRELIDACGRGARDH